LLNYREQPALQADVRLGIEFDEFFAALLMQKRPEPPLHNNLAKLAARFRVRKRDISFGPRAEGGRRAWDTFMTLAAATKRLGVSFCDTPKIRLPGNIPSPSCWLIQLLTKELNLGWSYSLA
jgi:hypothetical protein